MFHLNKVIQISYGTADSEWKVDFCGICEDFKTWDNNFLNIL